MEPLEFFFDGYGVGIFFQLPKTEGVYDFEPFRGIGHYDMVIAIKSQGYADCYFYDEDKKCYFKAEYEEATATRKSRTHSLKVTELACFLV